MYINVSYNLGKRSLHLYSIECRIVIFYDTSFTTHTNSHLCFTVCFLAAMAISQRKMFFKNSITQP
jgi:hypothetical protein